MAMERGWYYFIFKSLVNQGLPVRWDIGAHNELDVYTSDNPSNLYMVHNINHTAGMARMATRCIGRRRTYSSIFDRFRTGISFAYIRQYLKIMSNLSKWYKIERLRDLHKRYHSWRGSFLDGISFLEHIRTSPADWSRPPSLYTGRCTIRCGRCIRQYLWKILLCKGVT